MRNLKTLFLMAAILVACSAEAQKRDVGGEISLGARLGGNSGITLKRHGAYNKSAIEFIGQFDYAGSEDPDLKGFALTALWERLAPLSSSSQLSAMIGGGPSMNFKDEFNLGIAGIIGFDWRLKALPITLQADWMPSWYFVNASAFTVGSFAVSGRFVLNRKRYKR